MPKQAQVLAELEAQLGFTRQSNPEAFDAAVANLANIAQAKDDALVQRLGEATMVNDETGEVITLQAYAENLMRDASQHGVSIPDVVSLVKEITGRMVPLDVAFPKCTPEQLATVERQLLKHCSSDDSKGSRLDDTAPIYFDDHYSGLVAIQSPQTGEVAVVWRDFDEMVQLRHGKGEYPTFKITGIVRDIDEDEARSMLNDAMAARRAVWNDKVDGWGWAPPTDADVPAESAF